jgi:enoyl-CoA hydratase/carnithine racemase
MSFEAIRLTHEGGVSTITLDRPPVNAVTMTLLEEVLAALDEIEARPESRCVVLTGAGERAFCAGADLKAPAGPGNNRFRTLGRATLDRIERFPKPVISAIRGWCIGGGFALGMVCDVRLASTTAKFRTGDAYLGVVPSWGMSLTRLAHYIGRNRSLDLLVLGEDLDAAQAMEFGLLSKVIPDAEFEAEVARIAARVAGGSPAIFRAVKETIYTQYRATPDAAQALETHWADRVSQSEDMKEGMAAFRERRAPVFRDR